MNGWNFLTILRFWSHHPIEASMGWWDDVYCRRRWRTDRVIHCWVRHWDNGNQRWLVRWFKNWSRNGSGNGLFSTQTRNPNCGFVFHCPTSGSPTFLFQRVKSSDKTFLQLDAEGLYSAWLKAAFPFLKEWLQNKTNIWDWIRYP